MLEAGGAVTGASTSDVVSTNPAGNERKAWSMPRRQESLPERIGSLVKNSSQVELGNLSGGKLVHDNLSSPSASIHSGDSDAVAAAASVAADGGLAMKTLLSQKKAQLRNRLSSVESNNEGDLSDSGSLTLSETGSFMTNPAFRIGGDERKKPLLVATDSTASTQTVAVAAAAATSSTLTTMRSVVSDSELDQQSVSIFGTVPVLIGRPHLDHDHTSFTAGDHTWQRTLSAAAGAPSSPGKQVHLVRRISISHR